MKLLFLCGSFMLATLAAPIAARAQSTSPVDAVNQAVGAIGGADALRAMKSLTFKADAQFWEPQQSYVADGEPRLIGDSKITFTWKNDNDTSRTDWERKFEYPFVEEKKYSEIVTSKYGAVSAGSSEVPMSNIRFASYRRELERALPNLLLKALDAPATFFLRCPTKPSTASRCRPSPSPTATSSSPSCSIPRPSCRPQSALLTTTGSTGT